jgi:hypothetical protein
MIGCVVLGAESEVVPWSLWSLLNPSTALSHRERERDQALMEFILEVTERCEERYRERE